MRHRKRTFKIGRTGSHRRCMVANQLKSLIEHGRIQTSVRKAKELRRYADRMITLAKGGTLADRRRAAARLMVCYNDLSGKKAKPNADRQVVNKLFSELGPRFAERQGGYTRMIRTSNRSGDHSELCVIEFVS